ncbi:MAG: B12-binding domain-containing radical SAM protein [Anaerolineae bacterium]
MSRRGVKAGSKGNVLLVNPWIYDFAAHNLWIEPIGLLTIAAALRDNDYTVTVVDCLAPHPGAPAARADGSGKFAKTVLDKPDAVKFVPRRYGRYGVPIARFDAALKAAPKPDVILVGSGMTYWYPGVVEAITCLRARYGRVPVVLGGVYATLCPEHAQMRSGADAVITGQGVALALGFVDEVTGHDSGPEQHADPCNWPAPAHDLVARPFAAIVTSWGCPYRCTYCASHKLVPTFVRREPVAVVEEIVGCVQRGIQDFAFYDDALLVGGGRRLTAILEAILARGLRVRFHTPNGLHARGITSSLAQLMRRAGMATVRLSLETVNPLRQQSTGAKVTTDEFAEAVSHLRAAGYGPAELGAYILAGLPGQMLAEVEDTVEFVHGLGVQAKLALFSPIPGTPEGDRALAPGVDPLLHNNTVYPYLLGSDYAGDLQRVKQVAKEGNSALLRGLR